jgi:hypothetical protein
VQAPVLSQAVAPQVASLVEQALVQQFPVPRRPQTSEGQAEFSVQGLPAASKPPVVPVVAPPVLLAVPPEEPLHAAARSVRPIEAGRRIRT